MTPTAPSPVFDSSWLPHDHEARLLGALLRTSRLTLLFCEEGSNKTALLKKGLMPMLRRRASDRPVATARESGVVVPFPDRRRRASKRRREFVVYFDDWTDTPLAALRAAIYQAAATNPAERAAPLVRLREILADLSSRLDANFIILLDRFEEFLEAPSHRVDIAQFANELVEAINEVQLPANFLISLKDAADPRLATLRSRIPGFDDSSLKLAPPRDFKPAAIPVRTAEPPDPVAIGIPPVLTEAVPVPTVGSTLARPTDAAPAIRPPGTPKVKRPPPPRVQIKTEDVYALIEATLSRVAPGTASQPVLSDEVAGPMGMDNDHGPARQTQARPASAQPEHPGTDAAPAGVVASQPPGLPASPALTRRKNLREAVEWMGRRLRAKPKPKQGT